MTGTSEKPRVDPAVLAAMLAAAMMIAQQVFGKATRDALFLSTFQVTALPKALIAAAVLSLFAVLAAARAMTLYSPARVVPVSFAASAALFLAEWGLSGPYPNVAAVAVYLHLAIFGAIVTSGFWSLVNERFDPHTAKRVVGRIAAAGTAGSVVGGVLAWRAASLLSVPTMLVMLAAMNAVCAWGITRIRPAGPGHHPRGLAEDRSRAPSGLQVLREVPYLRQLGLLVALCALGESQLDYVLKATAASTFEGGGRLVTFFALFHMSTGIVSFVVQSTLSRPSLDRLGLAGTVALLPAAMVLAGFVALLEPALWSVILLCGVEAVLSTSLYRSGYELLYTPLAQERKRPTKAIIDVGLDRLGTTLGGGATMLVLLWAAGEAQRSLVGLTIAAALAALFVAIRLHEGYVASLAESLKSGAVRLDADEVFDATSRRTLWETNAALTRDRLLQELGVLRQSMVAAGTMPGTTTGRDTVSDAAGADELLQGLAALRSGDPARIRRVLRRPEPLEPILVFQVIMLLARDDVLKDAFAALRAVAERSTGQILDALYDSRSGEVVRRRIPRILQGCPTQRVADGLMLGLEDPSFEVRYRCAMALLKVSERNVGITISKERIFAAACRELEVGRKELSRAEPHLEPDEERDSPFIDDVLRTRADRHLEVAFAILSLALDRDPLKIAFRALATDDDGLRGTALEYLENILPDTIREPMRPYMGGDRRPVRPAPPRPRKLIVEELLQSTDSISLNLDALRKKAAGTTGE
ncbi:MAG: hypothetical protein HYY06_22660 [Deltaproteobacteria bacterium]|nr:hypothetical protein [Deltaproteobacteria bacterium]